MGHLTETDATEPELAVDRARPAAATAPCVRTDLELRLGLLLLDESLLCHSRSPLRVAAEREAERAEQRASVVVGLGRRHDRDVHAAHRVDLVVVDLREDQ